MHDVFVWRVRNTSTEKKYRLRVRTQDLLNASQTLLPLSHLDPWQRDWKTIYISSIA